MKSLADILVENGNRFSAEDSKAGRLQRAAYSLIYDHYVADQIPTSDRFLWYEAEQAGVVSKVRTGKRRADQDFIDAVTYLSNADLVPWNFIVDETRVVHSWLSANSVAEYVSELLPQARINPWAGVVRPVLIVEARTVGGVLTRTLGPEYLVPVAPTNGQTKRYLVNEVAPFLSRRKSTVLYIGDYDLAGNQIEENTKRVLERYSGRSFGWERIAITKSQADDLRAKGVEPIVKKDRRYSDGHEHEAYEAEALGQGYLTQIVKDALDSLLPEPLKGVLEREANERKKLAAKLKNNGGAS